MSWKKVSEAFRTSRENVYRSVQWAVQYGLAHRLFSQITTAILSNLNSSSWSLHEVAEVGALSSQRPHG